MEERHKALFLVAPREGGVGHFSVRTRTAERAPRQQAWERAGAQTKLFDEKVLVEGEMPKAVLPEEQTKFKYCGKIIIEVPNQ